MSSIHFNFPRKLVFGSGCIADCVTDLRGAGFRRIFLVTAPCTVLLTQPLVDALGAEKVKVYGEIAQEPTLALFGQTLDAARSFQPDAVVALGGGSVLDAAKLVAALWNSDQDVREVFGIDLLLARTTYLVCLPSSAGTGSEVSPNAILLDENEQLKKGVVSRFLVPDAAYVDPLLTLTVPADITAGTGIDALTHCIEAYTNKFSHPMADIYALEGIGLIAANLPRSVRNGQDIKARESLALGSLYGGMVLGPVNTAAVHALAYPLGGEFHVAHGLSNAVLLPSVMEFNAPAAPGKYARVAVQLGVPPGRDELATAMAGVQRIRDLASECGIPLSLKALGVPKQAIPRMASAAMKVTRLLKNNPRELTTADAESIYRSAYE